MPATRVLHVVSGLDRRQGGVAAAVVGLAAAQRRAGVAASVLSSFVAGDDLSAADELRAAGVPVTWAGPVFGRLMGYHPANARHAAAAVADADVVHVHALWEDLQHRAMHAARRRGVPYVVSPHGMLATWSLKQGRLKKRVVLAVRLRRHLNAAAALHFTTHQEAKEATPLALRPAALVEALGLDLPEFAELPPAGSFRDRYPGLAGRPLVLFLSRVHPKKGLDLLVPAFAGLRATDARLVIAGPADDDYAAVVRGLAARHGVADRVTFAGMLRGRDRIAAMADADVFVLPSYQENFGIVVPEALAAGTPVVISDQVNFAEHLAGRLFAGVVPCAVGPLTAELDRWLAAPDRRALGQAGRAWTLAHFDWAAVAGRWAGHYARMVTVRPPGATPVPSPGTPGEG